MRAGIRAVLFDLDGTLIDSAPDLAGAANDLRAVHGLPPLPYADLRPMVGSGARGMVGVAFGVAPGEPRFEGLRDSFLARYEARMLQETAVFAALQAVLDALAAAGLPWGIVTNKARRFAEPVVAGLKLAPAALVCGDTTPHAKPHPAPLLEAARQLGLSPASLCVRGRRPPRHRGRPCRRHAGAGGGLGLPGPGRDHRGLGCRCGAARCRCPLALAGTALNSELPWDRPGFDVGAESAQGMPSTSSLVNPLETK